MNKNLLLILFKLERDNVIAKCNNKSNRKHKQCYLTNVGENKKKGKKKNGGKSDQNEKLYDLMKNVITGHHKLFYRLG